MTENEPDIVSVNRDATHLAALLLASTPDTVREFVAMATGAVGVAWRSDGDGVAVAVTTQLLLTLVQAFQQANGGPLTDEEVAAHLVDVDMQFLDRQFNEGEGR